MKFKNVELDSCLNDELDHCLNELDDLEEKIEYVKRLHAEFHNLGY